MTELQPLTGKATLDTSDFRKGIQTVLSDLRTVRDLSKSLGTVTLGGKLGAPQAQRELEAMVAITEKAAKSSGVRAKDISETERQLRSLAGAVTITRNAWQTQLFTDDQAGKSAEALRDKLLRLAAAEGLSTAQVVKATTAAAAAQRTLDATRGELTKGGFGASASLGILDALSRISGPLGGAASLLGGAINAGLLNGLKAGKPEVGKGAADIGQEVIDSLKTRLEIHSPSEVTKTLGEYAADGFALGMKSGIPKVEAASAELGGAAETGIGEKLREIFGKSGNEVAAHANETGEALAEVGPAANVGAAGLAAFSLSAEAVAFIAGVVVSGLAVLGVAFTGAVSNAIEFQDIMASIKALTGPTGQELMQLSAAARTLDPSIAVGPREAAGAVLELAKAGLTATDVINGGLVGALTLAAAAGEDAATGAQLAAGAMTAFDLDAKDLPGVADTFANFANKTLLGAQDLAQGLAAVGPVALDAGLDFNQFSGYLATLSQGGFQNLSDAGTSLKTVLLALEAPSDNAQKALNRLKVNAFDSSGSLRPLLKIVGDLKESLSGLSTQERDAALKNIFGSDGIRAALVLLKQGPEAIQANIDAMGKQGEAARVAKERNESFAGQMRVLNTELDTLGTDIGLLVVPTLTQLAKVAVAIGDAFVDLVNNGDKVKQYAQDLGIAITGIGLALAYVKREAIAIAAVNIYNSFVGTVGFAEAAAGAILNVAKAFKAATIASYEFIAANPWLLLIAGAVAAGLAINDVRHQFDEVYAAQERASKANADLIKGIRDQGTELSRAKADYLQAFANVQKAQAGDVVGRTLFGEDIIKVDPAYVARTNQVLEAARQNLVAIRTEALRHQSIETPVLGPHFTAAALEAQGKALSALADKLADRKLLLTGGEDGSFGAAVAKLQNEFNTLRQDLKKPFQINGDYKETAESAAALKALDAQQAAEKAALTKKFSDAAAQAAKMDALATQKAEIDALREGSAKRLAQRDFEIAQVTAKAQELADKYKEFPKQEADILADGQRQKVAIREKFAREEERIARDSAQRIQDAEGAAQDAAIAALDDGLAKKDLIRARNLEKLIQSINRQAKAAQDSGDTAGAAGILSSGREQVAAQEIENQKQHARDVLVVQKIITDAQKGAEDAQISAMQDGLAKREAVRARDLRTLRDSIVEKARALAGDLDAQRAVLANGQVELNAKAAEQARQRAEEYRTAQESVLASQKTARDGAIALIDNEKEHRRQAENAELADLQAGLNKRLEDLRGYGALQQGEIYAAQQQVQQINAKYAKQEQDAALATAKRIADGWQAAADARVRAEQAASQVILARIDADAARRIAQARDSAVEVAQIELDAAKRRSAEVEREATAQGQRDRAALTAGLATSLTDGSLKTAQEVQARKQQYLNDTAALDARLTAEATQRDTARLQSDLQGQEKLRTAYLGLVQTRAQLLDGQTSAVQRQAQISGSDADVFAAYQLDTANRKAKLADQQDLLRGIVRGGALIHEVALTDDQRRQVNEKITALKLDQEQADKDALATARALTDSVFDRLDAEAAFALTTARTDEDKVAAQRRQINAEKARLADVEARLAKADNQKDRNTLDTQRLRILGQISSAEQQIKRDQEEAAKQAAADAQARRESVLNLLDAQAGFAEKVARTDAATQAARFQALDAYRQRLAELDNQIGATRTDTERNALVVQRIGLSGQLFDLEEKISRLPIEQAQRQYDLLTARLKAAAQLSGYADDAVASAALEVRLTQQSLALNARKQADATLTEAGRSDLLKEQITLTGELAAQERKLQDAQDARLRLLESLGDAERGLTREMAGGRGEAKAMADSLDAISEARIKLARAQRDYVDAQERFDALPTTSNAEKLKTATEGLTGATKGQRDAVKALADQYGTLITAQDGVRDAADKLKSTLNPAQDAKINSNREIDRFFAIQTRRDTAIAELKRALGTGDAEAIRLATDTLATQEKRYQDQAKSLEKNGIRVGKSREREVAALQDKVDVLGIQYDKEAAVLLQRKRVADQEAAAVQRFGGFVASFSDAVGTLNRSPSAAPALPPTSAAASIASPPVAPAPIYVTVNLPPNRDERERRWVLADLTVDAVSGIRDYLVEGFKPLIPQPVQVARTPATAPAVNHTVTYTFGDIHVSAPPNLNPRQIAQGVRREFEEDIRRNPVRCK